MIPPPLSLNTLTFLPEHGAATGQSAVAQRQRIRPYTSYWALTAICAAGAVAAFGVGVVAMVKNAQFRRSELPLVSEWYEAGQYTLASFMTLAASGFIGIIAIILLEVGIQRRRARRANHGGSQ